MLDQSTTPADVSIDVRNVSKCYHIYSRPQDRLLQLLLGRKRRFYKEFWALKDVNLTVRRGESVALVGRNGAGKSTLLQVISGVLQPTAGTASITGRIAPLLELGTSFNPEFTGMENIALSASVLGLTEEQIAERRGTIAAFADIGDFIHQPVRTYSSGMQARLAFAVAAHVDAEVLIVDEILSVGDISFTQKCTRFIREFRERGTLLFVSHDLAAVTSLCDRAVWLNGGQLIEDDVPKEVVNHYQAWMANPQGQTDPVTYIAQQRERAAAAAESNVEQEDEAKVEVTAEVGGPAPDPAKADPLVVAAEMGLPPAHISRAVVFDFNKEADWSGARGISIVDATFQDANGNRTTLLHGGTKVTLAVDLETSIPIISPIVGFSVYDRLGQLIFAWDTTRDTDIHSYKAKPGDRFRAYFKFVFPYIAGGRYTMNLAVAEGTPTNHEQHHWLYHVLEFDVHYCTVANGMIGVPMHEVGICPLPSVGDSAHAQETSS